MYLDRRLQIFDSNKRDLLQLLTIITRPLGNGGAPWRSKALKPYRINEGAPAACVLDG